MRSSWQSWAPCCGSLAGQTASLRPEEGLRTHRRPFNPPDRVARTALAATRVQSDRPATRQELRSQRTPLNPPGRIVCTDLVARLVQSGRSVMHQAPRTQRRPLNPPGGIARTDIVATLAQGDRNCLNPLSENARRRLLEKTVPVSAFFPKGARCPQKNARHA